MQPGPYQPGIKASFRALFELKFLLDTHRTARLQGIIKTMDFRIARFFLQITRPLVLLGGVLVYALGVGIAQYLGTPINWAIVTLGQAWVTTFQIGFHFLRLVISEDNDENPIEIRRELVLWGAFAAFAGMTSLTLILMVSNGLNGSILILQALMMVGAILYTVPPFRLIYSGYGELILSIIMANLIPGLAFLLQYGDIHRLLGMCTFPLTMLYLAKLLTVQLPGYLTDFKNGHQTLLVRLGWARGMTFHNILILSAFLLIGVAMLFGLPTSVALPIFFVLPLGLFQLWYMTRIAGGAKPNWRIMRLTAILTFGLTTYLFTFAFWIR
jgi:1,4-dihydroxy-2-naphthoate octaprenyltransferase